jgi:glutamyl-Q tRNA(Asp) synthetase
MGPYQQKLSSEVGDFVLQRRDKLFSYQLAVVVDDQFQSVNQVMRGADLLDSTPRQIYLQQSLGYQQPEYAHLPLALNSEGQKLSKQNHAVSLQAGKESENLWQALDWLRQKPPKELQYQSVNEILVWAMSHWDVQRLGHQLGVRPKNTAVPEGY